MNDTTDDTSSTGTGDDRWTREASLNPVLAAAEIYFMACPWERVPWRDLLQGRGGGGPSPEELFARPPPPPEGWARRRTRRRRSGPPVLRTEDEGPAVVAAKEPRRMDSPTTPLSWTTAAASSGSGSGSGRCEAAREDDAVTTAAAAAASVVAVAGTKRQRRSDAGTTAAVPAPAVSWSSDAAPAAAGDATGRSVLGLMDAIPGTTTDGAVPTGSGGGGGAAYASVSKTTRLLLGKKMTLGELKCYEQSLLQKNIEMRKEVELQRKAQKVLLEENTRLKMIKSKHQPQAARRLFTAAKEDAADSGKCQFLPFDLNMPAAVESVDPGKGFYCE